MKIFVQVHCISFNRCSAYSLPILLLVKGKKKKKKNQLFHDPSLTHKGRSGAKSDWLSRLFTYGLQYPF